MKDVWVHDIVNGITSARGYAEFLAEQHPEVTKPVRRLVGELTRAEQAFVDAVMPILRPSKAEPL